ncbi:MAG: hypothetical protein AVDCRST_MAG23-677 [uncultured Sphingosinicella sp.]|uniref:Peptidase inhibitor I78 family protein n=1 Tax=uncultured Sphingosinicella sp. TaxID=478748 RepID=A0A6J4TMA9_9SPHN|nr:I78 family peptidase inhibitor [uncultured Sphingosinicella sp.]CAA9527246.1 MAG: hypothetical protein AVDCRST_MAG23-677 [uncultured Sphingosinicella sp.]
MRILAAALLMTSACMTPAPADVGVEQPVPVHGSTPGYRCDVSRAQGLVGQASSSTLGGRALELTGARTIRWIRPGDAVTMDYREDRLNIHLTGRGRVERLACG